MIFFSAPVLPALLYLNLCLINKYSSYLIRTDGFLVSLRCVLTFICRSLLFILKLYSFLLWFQLQDTETTTGESEVKFQVSRDTLGAMLRSMAYIREQLSISVSTLFLLLVTFFHFWYMSSKTLIFWYCWCCPFHFVEPVFVSNFLSVHLGPKELCLQSMLIL